MAVGQYQSQQFRRYNPTTVRATMPFPNHSSGWAILVDEIWWRITRLYPWGVLAVSWLANDHAHDQTWYTCDMILKTIKYMTMIHIHVDGFYWLKGLPIMRDQRSTVPSMRDQLVQTIHPRWVGPLLLVDQLLARVWSVSIFHHQGLVNKEDAWYHFKHYVVATHRLTSEYLQPLVGQSVLGRWTNSWCEVVLHSLVFLPLFHQLFRTMSNLLWNLNK